MDREFLIDLFSDFGPVTIRPMFSGFGISVDGFPNASFTGSTEDTLGVSREFLDPTWPTIRFRSSP